VRRVCLRAARPRAGPPQCEPRCGIASAGAADGELRIISPEEHVEYRFEPRRALELELLASAPADAKELFWFVGDTLVERAAPSASLRWKAKVGSYLVRV